MEILMSESYHKIEYLHSGGIITNYYCTSRCRHCLYASCPEWENEYIKEDTLAAIIHKIRELGCSSVHIGGGEPFLNPGRLEDVLKTTYQSGMHIEYIETNSSWYRDSKSACHILTRLKNKGLSTLLISISPFHNEYIPFSKVIGVIQACRKSGIQIFPWIQDFYPEISAFNPDKKHTLIEYEEKYGEDYIKNIPSRYWITYRGRALKTYARFMEKQPLHKLLSMAKRSCSELLDTHHFHFDLYGSYLPGLCSGLSIQSEDLGENLDKKKYPFLTVLMEKGINGLFTLAEKNYQFIPKPTYVSKCELCTDIRSFLVKELKLNYPDLQPVPFYEYV